MTHTHARPRSRRLRSSCRRAILSPRPPSSPPPLSPDLPPPPRGRLGPPAARRSPCRLASPPAPGGSAHRAAASPVAQSEPGGVTSRLTRKKCRGDERVFWLGCFFFCCWVLGFFCVFLVFFFLLLLFSFFFKSLPGKKAPDVRLLLGSFRVSRWQRLGLGNCWDVIANAMRVQWRYREVAVDLCSYASYVEHLRI